MIENNESKERWSPPVTPTSLTFPTSPIPPSSQATPSTASSFARRLSTIFPFGKQQSRNDSTFTTDSFARRASLWPFKIEEKLPTIFGYKDSNIKSDTKSEKFKFGWINGVYVSQYDFIQFKFKNF